MNVLKQDIERCYTEICVATLNQGAREVAGTVVQKVAKNGKAIQDCKSNLSGSAKAIHRYCVEQQFFICLAEAYRLLLCFSKTLCAVPSLYETC